MVRLRGLALRLGGLCLRENTEICPNVLAECKKKGSRGYYVATRSLTYPLSALVTRQSSRCDKKQGAAALA